MQMISNLRDASHHPRMKHFRVEGHWLRELVDHSDAKITYVKSADNVTDILVKGLSWEYDIFSRTCDCSRVVSGGRYFRFGFGFGTVFSFRWYNWLFGFEFEFVIVSVVSQLRLFVRENLLGRQSSVWMSGIIKSV